MTEVPAAIRSSLQRYAEEHVPTGGFLRAVLENDLMETLARADKDNRAALLAICLFVYNELPASCWGSPDKVRAWLEASHGRVGTGAVVRRPTGA